MINSAYLKREDTDTLMYSIYSKTSGGGSGGLPSSYDLEREGKLWLMSCDIGKRNFAYSIVEISLPEMKKLDMNSDLKKVYENSRIISMDLQDFVGSTNVKVSQDIFNNITIYMDSMAPYFDLCKAFVLEKQLKKNPEAQRIEQHIYSYLVIRYRLTKDVIPFLSKLKYTETGLPVNIKKKYYRKKWAWMKCKEILEEIGDKGSLDYIFKVHKDKKDDLSDTLLQIYGFCKRVYAKKKL